MNEKAEIYWNTYWKGKVQPSTVSAWAFGDDPDKLARLAIDGVKTATCSAKKAYEIENELLPKEGEYSIILNKKEDPVAIIKTSAVDITPFNQVTEEFAREEGEGDRSYQYWRETHIEFFNNEAEELGYTFSESMPLVCERFQLIDVNQD
ncbi:ASCH domain-containing protein [Halobacillus litoralis]|uniref:ASCH domain-containing protein n=1 Tax=Halobacillus litoralis TaxID=45668 RepID=UPI001CFC6A61|nr:ASCH domain-containing protein [Halobacillus litoralis]